VGKSEFAVCLAERCGGEIVGADAFQVYAGLPLLTAKPSPELLDRAPHHLIGDVPLTHSLDVGQYAATARRVIAEIQSRGSIPIIVGGTGLYIRTLLCGMADLPRADPELRRMLDTLSAGELHALLTAHDPEGARTIDSKNPRRLVRALEICLLTNRPFSSFRQQWADARPSTCGVMLNRDRSELYQRIEQRTIEMFAAGAVEEVRSVGDEIGPTASQAIGFREIRGLISGEMSLPECTERIQRATRRYAKRQLTWFRREPSLEPVNLSLESDAEALLTRLTERIIALRS